MSDKRKQAESTTHTIWPLIRVTKSVMRVVVTGESGDLQSRKGSDRFLETLSAIGRGRRSCAYPSKSQSHLEHEMRTEYDQEVPRRILGDGSQKGRAPDIWCPRLCCQEYNQREREEIWCVHIAARVSRNECHYSCKFRVIS